MLFPIHVLEDCEARVAGLSLERALARLTPQRVRVVLGDASLRHALWNLPILEAIGARFPTAELRIHARPDVLRLLHGYERGPSSNQQTLTSELEVLILGDNAASAPAQLEAHATQHRLLVPARPFPMRLQRATEHAVDAAQAAGLPARRSELRLQVDPALRKEARALARQMTGNDGPLLALAPVAGGWPVASFAHVAQRLSQRMAARSLVFGDLAVPGVARVLTSDLELQAGLLGLAAACVGDDGGFAHLAAMVGTPTLIAHGDSEPAYAGPTGRHGISAFTTKGTCSLCKREPGRRCLACLEPAKVAVLAERLAAKRWPLDRVQRAMP